MDRKEKRISASLIVMAVGLLIAALMIPSAVAAPAVPPGEEGIYFLVPKDSTAQYCENVTIDVRVNSSIPIRAGMLVLDSDLVGCGEIVDCEYNSTEWTSTGTQVIVNSSGYQNAAGNVYIPGGYRAYITFAGPAEKPPGDYSVGEIEVHCNCTSGCLTNLTFYAGSGELYITNNTAPWDYEIPGENGTFQCQAAPPINVDIHAEGINGDVINATNYAVYPGTVTEDGITMNNHTAMGAMVAYCQDNGINVWITSAGWGNYTIQIGNDAANNNSWMYAVDGVSPWIAGDKYDLSGGEYVHWYNYLLTYNLTVTSAGCCPINVTYGWGLTDTVPAGQTKTYGAGYYYDAALEALDSSTCRFKKWVYDSTEDPVNKSITVHMDGNKTATAYCSEDVTLEVDAPSGCVDGNFIVNITADPNGLEVYGVQYELAYNASVIRLNMQNEGDLLNQGASTTVYANTIDNINGKATFGVSRKDNTNGTTTAGTVAVLSFTTVGNPHETSNLTLSNEVVSDNNANKINATLTNDNVTLCDPNQPPVANASSDHKYNNVGTVFYCKAVLNGSLSYDPDGSITQWLWAFGDGNFDSGEIRKHTYASYQWTGSNYIPYIANLTVTDNGGASDDDGCEVMVFIPGEANGDGKVNVLDAAMIGLRWNKVCADYTGVCWGCEDMADRADLNNDCWVNIQDAVTVGANWGNTA